MTQVRIMELEAQLAAVVREREDYNGKHQQVCNEIERLRAALTLIAAFGGKTLIAPSLGPDVDYGHQIGANKAFDQAAEIARDALAEGRT